MTIQRPRRGMEGTNTDQRRLRLRDWLEMRIGDRKYPGLRWENQRDGIFRIPWKHGARHGWKEEEDARLFREWSEHTGASPKDVKQHKANFRCALNSLRDVEQLPVCNKSKGDDAYRLYKLLPKRSTKSGSKWIRKRTPSTKAPSLRPRRPQFAAPPTSPFAHERRTPLSALPPGSPPGTFRSAVSDGANTYDRNSFSQYLTPPQTREFVYNDSPTPPSAFPTYRMEVATSQPAVHNPPYHGGFPNPRPFAFEHFADHFNAPPQQGQSFVYPLPQSPSVTIADALGKATAAVQNYPDYGRISLERAPSVTSTRSTNPLPFEDILHLQPSLIDTPPLEEDASSVGQSFEVTQGQFGKELMTLSQEQVPSPSYHSLEDVSEFLKGDSFDDNSQIWDLTTKLHKDSFSTPLPDQQDHSFNIDWVSDKKENLQVDDTLLDFSVEDFPSGKLEPQSEAVCSDVDSVFSDDTHVPGILRSFTSGNSPPFTDWKSSPTRLPSAYTLLSPSNNVDETLRSSPPWRYSLGSDEIGHETNSSVTPAVVYGNC